MIKKQRYNSGFTLIEMMVATSIFVIVALTVTGAIMLVIQSYRRSENAKLLSDNLNFAMEKMVLELREGSGYQGYNQCTDEPDNKDNCKAIQVKSSRSGKVIKFSLDDNGKLFEQICNNETDCPDGPLELLDPNVQLEDTGSLKGLAFNIGNPNPTNPQDAYGSVIITMNGVAFKDTKFETRMTLQTTVSQRNL